MSRLNVNICGVEFKNPVITASGTYGFGREYNEFYPISKLGGISSKGMTIREKAGNPPPRIAETPSGILNSVGLQNPGVDHFIEKDLPWLREQDVVIIANIAGATEDDYAAIAEKVNASEVDMVELNISCPNVKAGGAAFGTSCAGAEQITSLVRKHCPNKPLIVKLSPNVTDITEIARAVEGAGADSVSLINTMLGMAIDAERRKPILSTVTGGMSGPAVKPVALRMVWQVAKAVKIPVIGLGGICSATDAIEFLLAGASAIQIGTANFIDPAISEKVVDGIEEYLTRHGFNSVQEVIGALEV